MKDKDLSDLLETLDSLKQELIGKTLTSQDARDITEMIKDLIIGMTDKMSLAVLVGMELAYKKGKVDGAKA